MSIMQHRIADSTDEQDIAHRNLWAAVLHQGVLDCRNAVMALATGTKPRAPNDIYNAHLRNRRWLYSRETYPGSLVWICRLLGLDPNRVRQHVMDAA